MGDIKGTINSWLYTTSIESIVDILAEIAADRAWSTEQNRNFYGEFTAENPVWEQTEQILSSAADRIESLFNEYEVEQ